MTSGIRNNWMKAIRLVMDLQQSGGSKNNSGESEQSSGEDLEINLSNSGRLSLSPDSRSSTESPKLLKKDQTTKNVRRHYSDVSPGNVSKILSVKEVLPSLNLESITLPPILSDSLPSSRENSVEKEESKINPIIITEVSSPESDSLSLGASGTSLKRFVEGSDHISAESAVSTSLGVSSESRKEEAEKERRAKSPSARIKDKSRVRSPRLHSPQDTDEELLEHSSDRVDGLSSVSRHSGVIQIFHYLSLCSE